MRDPAELRGHIHPALKSIPELAEDSQEFLAIAAGVGQVGVLNPLLVDEQGRILDDHSRTVLRCALRWQLREVPVQVLPDANAPMVIIHSLIHRRHLTKAACLYLTWNLYGPAVEKAVEQQRIRVAKGIKKANDLQDGLSPSYAKTKEELARELGCDPKMFDLCAKVVKLFADPKKYWVPHLTNPDSDPVELTLREYFEPKLLRAPIGGEHEQNRPIGFAGILAGAESIKEENKEGAFSSRKNLNERGQMFLFERKVDLAGGWKYYMKSSDEERQRYVEHFRQLVARLSDDEKDAMAEFFGKLEDTCRKVKKAA